MRISVVFYCVLTLSGVTAIVQQRKRESEWIFQTIRGHLDSPSRLDSVNARFLIGCSSLCSSDVGTDVQSLYFEPETGQCVCNVTKDEIKQDDNGPEIQYGMLSTRLQVETTDAGTRQTTVGSYRRDCFDLLRRNHDNGVYMIHPTGGHVTDTWCDMDNGGWTVIQRRMDGSEEFYRGWNDYVNGFGNRTGEYWLGLESIHQLTKFGSELVVYMEAFPGYFPISMTAHYSIFQIGDKLSQYRLNVTGYNGTCGDALGRDNHNGQVFSIFDNFRYGSPIFAKNNTGWWYSRGFLGLDTILNGEYLKEGKHDGGIQPWIEGLLWLPCWKFTSSKYAVMKVRRKQGSK